MHYKADIRIKFSTVLLSFKVRRDDGTKTDKQHVDLIELH